MNEQNSLLGYFSPGAAYNDTKQKKPQGKQNRRYQYNNKEQIKNYVMEPKHQQEIIKIIDPRIYATGLQLLSEVMNKNPSSCGFSGVFVQEESTIQNIFYQHQCGALQLLYLEKQWNQKRNTTLKEGVSSTFFELDEKQQNQNDTTTNTEIINLQIQSSHSDQNSPSKSVKQSQKVIQLMNQPLEKFLDGPIKFDLFDEQVSYSNLVDLVQQLMQKYPALLIHIPCDSIISPFTANQLNQLENQFLVHNVGNVFKIVTLLIINEFALNLRFDLFKYTQFFEAGVQRISDLQKFILQKRSERNGFLGYLHQASLNQLTYATTGPLLPIPNAQMQETFQSLEINEIFSKIQEKQLSRLDIFVIDLCKFDSNQLHQQFILDLRPLFDYIAFCSPKANQTVLETIMKQFEHLEKFFVTSRLLLVSTRAQYLRFDEEVEVSESIIQSQNDVFYGQNVKNVQQNPQNSLSATEKLNTSYQADYTAAKRSMQAGRSTQISGQPYSDNKGNINEPSPPHEAPEDADGTNYELEMRISDIQLQFTRDLKSLEAQIQGAAAKLRLYEEELPHLNLSKETLQKFQDTQREVKIGLQNQDNQIKELKNQLQEVVQRVNGLFTLLGSEEIQSGTDYPPRSPVDDISVFTGFQSTSGIQGRQKSQYSSFNILRETGIE